MRRGLAAVISIAIIANAGVANAGDNLQFASKVPVNAAASTDRPEDQDFAPSFAVRDSTVVAVWEFDPTDGGVDVFYARSVDGGATWSNQWTLNAGGQNWVESEPDIAVNDDGEWMAVWQSQHDVNGLGTDHDILGALSTDDGQTWTNPFPINPDATTDSAEDIWPAIAGGPDGTWIATWSDTEGLGISRSTDSGTTWSPQISLSLRNSNRVPRIATRGGGVWAIVCEAWNSSFQENDVAYTFSSDDGQTWAPLAFLNEPSTGQILSHAEPDIAFDNDGNAIAVWMVRATSNDAGIPTMDPFYAISTDGGVIFGSQNSLYPDPLALRSTSFQPRIATDGDDNWVAVWNSTKRHNGLDGGGGDQDMWQVESVDDGQSWSAPQLLQSDDANDGTVGDFDGAIVSNKKGLWLGGFVTLDPAFGNPPNLIDEDIFATQGFFTGFLTGTLTREDNGDPVGSASLRIFNNTIGVERIAVTDRLGKYRVDNIPEGEYTIEIWAFRETPLERSRANGTATVVRGAVTKANFVLSFVPVLEGVWGQVFGQVVPGSSDNRVPLVGVKVQAFAPIGPGGSEVLVETTYSAGDGTYAVNELLAAKGTSTQVRVNFDALGFVNDDRTPTIDPGLNAESNPTLEQKAIGFAATLSGQVTEDNGGTGIEEALVEIEGPVRAARVTEIGSGGAYTFDSIPPSTYTARISKVGFFTKELSVSVPSDLPKLFNVSLVANTGQETPPEDINKDGTANAVDVQLVINSVLGFNLGGLDGDVNGDNARNSVDIQTVINFVLGG